MGVFQSIFENIELDTLINNIMSKADEKSVRKFVVKYFFDKLIKESEYWDVLRNL